MCKIIDAFPSKTSKLIKTFSTASVYYNYSSNQQCFNIENETDEHGLDGWNRQRIKQVLRRYGSNITFSNGLRDPWSRGRVLSNISSSIIALVTKKRCKGRACCRKSKCRVTTTDSGAD